MRLGLNFNMEILQILQKKMDVYGYIIADKNSGDCAVIDPSTQPDKLYYRATASDYKIKAIINTHGHGDHTCGNSYLIKKTGAPLYLHKKDASLAAKMSSRVFSRALGGRPCPTPDVYLENGDIIEAGSLLIEVIHTPGHTKGSICLYCEGNVFTGDTLFVGDVGRTDLPGGSFEQLKKSIKTALFTLPKDTIVWPGHNYSAENKSSIGKEIKTNPYL